MNEIIVPDRLPWLVRILGVRFREYPLKQDYRMTWGSLAWGRWGIALALDLFSEHYSFHVHIGPLNAYVNLPMLQRWHRAPHEIMESWGFGTFDGAMHLHWGRHTKIVTFPWADWKHLTHDVRRADGSWVPFVGSWEERQEGRDGKDPDGRQTQTFPYRYVTKRGQIQDVDATIFMERRRWKLRGLPIYRVRHSIDVAFSDEVGDERGSWKGGTVGCGYDLRPDETPRECLKRMERERRFDR